MLKHNKFKIQSMFLHQIHPIFFIHNWTYKKIVVLKIEIKTKNMKNLWF
jgi:hypothetical protein